DKLLDVVLLQSDIMDLKARTKGLAVGTIIESKITKGDGVVATFLVQEGTLSKGDIVASLSSQGKVRLLRDHKGTRMSKAGPSTPVEVVGLKEVPKSGDRFMVVDTERQAQKILKESKERKRSSVVKRVIKFGQEDIKKLYVLLKADVAGSLEVLVNIVSSIKHEEVEIQIIHSGVGDVSLSDVALAKSVGATIFGFNVSTGASVRKEAGNEIQIHCYDVIYELEQNIKDAVSDILSPIIKEVKIGTMVVRKIFNISKIGRITGCYVQDGMVDNDSLVKIIRNGKIIGESKIKSIKIVNDSVKEAKNGYECGLNLISFHDCEEGDKVEAYRVERHKQKI
ncbi:translation initiation factor IF-2, partial [Rickettsiales bacterium]|nr:translation initiation factor IF-2 [Rickettsiales bacterium]